ncbi:MAG TPA: XrtA system polysaccharide chain length determinant [Steroidobacteraceae bacterium]|nr:XrtA system polysaccharide chain length determinant [Steroidobacteraceae bacterium]
MNLLAQQLRDEVRGMWRFRWKAMAVAWAALVVGAIAVASLPDTYMASAKVYVDSGSRLGKLLQGLAVETNVEAQIAVVRQTLLGRPNLERLTRSPEYASKRALETRTQAQQDRMIESLRKKIEILPIRGAETAGALILVVSFQDESRDRALFVVRSLVEGFVSETQDVSRAKAEEAQSFLVKELDELEDKLATAEDKLAQFKKDHFGVLPGQGGDYFTRLQTERQGLDQARSQLDVIVSQRNALSDQLRGQAPLIPTGQPTDFAAAGRKDIDARIKESESRLEELLLRYTEKHPEVIALQQTIAELKQRRADELAALQSGGAGSGSMSVADNPLYQSIRIQLNKVEVDIAAARADIAQRERRIADLQRSINTAPDVEAELGRLNRDYGVVKAQYEALLDRLQRARLSESAEETGVVQFKVIEPPTAKFEPVGPNRLLMMIAVLLGSIGAAGALCYVMHQLRPVIGNANALADLTRLPVLGTVSIGRLEEHRAEMRSSALRFATAFGGLLVVFGVALLFRNDFASLLRQI